MVAGLGIGKGVRYSPPNSDCSHISHRLRIKDGHFLGMTPRALIFGILNCVNFKCTSRLISKLSTPQDECPADRSDSHSLFLS